MVDRPVQPDTPSLPSTSAQPRLYRWDELVPEQLNPLLTRQFVTGSQAMLARIVLGKGCLVPEHAHANEQISYVVSGALEFRLAGVPTVVRAGEVLVIPGGVQHSALALEDTVDFDVFAPPRQDWIDRDDSYLR